MAKAAEVKYSGSTEVHAIAIFCPACGYAHQFKIGTPQENGAVWNWNGSLTNPTFTPSMLSTTPEMREDNGDVLVSAATCHSYVTDGKIIFLGDCTHNMKNQTVELQDFDTLYPSWNKPQE